MLWWAILFPALSIPAVAAIWVSVDHGARAGLGIALAAVAAYIRLGRAGTGIIHPVGERPLRHRWLAWWRYHRTWESVCALHGLTAKHGEHAWYRPSSRRASAYHADTLTVKVVTGPMPHRLAETRSGVGGGVAGRAVDNPGHHAGAGADHHRSR